MEDISWMRCEGAVRLRLGSTIKMQIARSFLKGECMRNANNVGWGVQTIQQFIQHLETMELLATVTQHFWLGSNFTQHRKCQCWVTQNGVQTIQQFIQHLKTMELLATVTQHFWLESNFTQHRKCQCWVTQHGVQTIQHFTQHQCWANVGWNFGSFEQAFKAVYTRYLKHVLSCLLQSVHVSDFKTLAYILLNTMMNIRCIPSWPQLATRSIVLHFELHWTCHIATLQDLEWLFT